MTDEKAGCIYCGRPCRGTKDTCPLCNIREQLAADWDTPMRLTRQPTFLGDASKAGPEAWKVSEVISKWHYQGCACAGCGIRAHFGDLELDHIEENDARTNPQLLCGSCSARKSGKTSFAAWIESVGEWTDERLDELRRSMPPAAAEAFARLVAGA